MSALLDSSILVAALLPNDPDHAACAAALSEPRAVVYVHALNETFATLTGGKLGFRLDAEVVANLIRERIIARLEVIVLSGEETGEAHRKARAYGVRGGAVYDYMHLVAARKANATALYTLNLEDFIHLRRAGDPEVRRP